jgi:PIN domain nuclease of toxin-antitoxin system
VKYLLDSHIFLWWANEPERLSPRMRTLLEEEQETLLRSLASIWEMQIKIQLGKLTVSPALEAVIETQQRANGLQLLPISLPPILAVGTLPFHHRDPFDRLIIAQAIQENVILVSIDPIIRQYPVQLFR